MPRLAQLVPGHEQGKDDDAGKRERRRPRRGAASGSGGGPQGGRERRCRHGHAHARLDAQRSSWFGLRTGWTPIGPAGMSAVVITASSAWSAQASAWPTRASNSSLASLTAHERGFERADRLFAVDMGRPQAARRSCLLVCLACRHECPLADPT